MQHILHYRCSMLQNLEWETKKREKKGMASLAADGLRINRRLWAVLPAAVGLSGLVGRRGWTAVWHVVAEGGGHFFRSTQLQQQTAALSAAESDRRRRH